MVDVGNGQQMAVGQDEVGTFHQDGDPCTAVVRR